MPFPIFPLDKLRYISYNKKGTAIYQFMQYLLQGKIRMNLAEQTAERIKEDLRTGALDPESRLPGYRVLGQRYGVSDGTARKAFEHLENASVLQRRNRSGTYVSPLFLKDFEEVRLLSLVFPEKAISMKELNEENYAICMEIFQGLMHEASNWNTRVEFRYMPETDNRILLEQQVRQLKDSHGVVMIGGQLRSLQRQLKKAGIPVRSIFCWQEMGRRDEINCVESLSNAMETICSYLRKAGYQKVVSIAEKENSASSVREQELKLKAFRTHGLTLEASLPSGAPELRELLRQHDPGRIFFLINTSDISWIYRFAYTGGLRIGQDFDLLGLASGVTCANYFPPLSYFRIPYFELGCVTACTMLGKPCGQPLKITYVQGETTRKMQSSSEKGNINLMEKRIS